MALNFPANPAIGDIYEGAGYHYKWDGVKWMTIQLGEKGVNELIAEAIKEAAKQSQRGRNLLINGGMRVNQRVFTSIDLGADSGAWCFDRWYFYTTKPCTIRAGNKAANADGQDFDGSGHLLAFGAKEGDSAFELHHKIESLNCTGLSGKQLTLSFEMYASSDFRVVVGIKTPTVSDDFLNLTDIESIYIPIKAGQHKYSVTSKTTPNITNGLRLGIIGDSYQSNMFFKITNIQLEVGSVATDFERVDYEEELIKCQRYFQGAFTYHGRKDLSGNWVTFNVPFIRGMRALPTFVEGVRIYNGNSGGVMADPAPAPATFGLSGSGWFNIAGMPNAPEAGNWVGVHFRGFDAEL